MNARNPRVIRWPLVTLLATGSCITIGPVCGPIEPPCASNSFACTRFDPRIVSEVTARFEAPCPGATCDATAERGAVSSAPAVHPAERALSIERGTTAVIRVQTFAPADGANLTGLARCEAGGSLALIDVRAASARRPIPPSASWEAFDMVLQRPFREFVAVGESIVTPTVATLRFKNTGSAPCFLSRLVYQATANICSRFECVLPMDAQSPPRDARVDAIAAMDVASDAVDDGRSEDATDARDASETEAPPDADFDGSSEPVDADSGESVDSAEGA